MDMMRRKLIRRSGAAIALVVVLAAAAPAADAVRHFALARSIPAADATTASAEAIRLWYTQVPQEGTLTVRLVGPAGDLVATEAPAADPDDRAAITVPVPSRLPVGRYGVAWRGAGDDGHVMSGEFAFTVAAAFDGGADR